MKHSRSEWHGLHNLQDARAHYIWVVEQTNENLLLWRTTGVDKGRNRSKLLETLRWGRKQAGDLLEDHFSAADHRECGKLGRL